MGERRTGQDRQGRDTGGADSGRGGVHVAARRGGREPADRRPSEWLLLDDPMAALPPTARRLLDAARRILIREGYGALTFAAIAAEAGEAKGSIGYHFGNKDGLMAALVDSLVHDANRALISECEAQPSAGARVRALVDGESRIVADAESFQAFFEMLPHALRDPELRRRVATLYDGYRETVWRCLNDADSARAQRLRPFAVLMIAIVDGLAIQHGLDPERADVTGAIRLWEQLAQPLLAELDVAP